MTDAFIVVAYQLRSFRLIVYLHNFHFIDYLLRTSGHHMSTKVAEDCGVSVSEAIDSRRRSYSLSPIPAKRTTSGKKR